MMKSGQLTEKVRRNPYSIVLLDEIEKAHPDVMHMFLQILDDGRLTDAQGRTVSFKDTIIIMTSNLGTGNVEASVGFGATNNATQNSVLDQLTNYFKPEFINRFDAIVEFNQLDKTHLIKIVDLLLLDVNHMLVDQGISIVVDEATKEKLVELGYDPKMGARPLRRVIQEQIEDKIADFYLDHPEIKELAATTDANGDLIVTEKSNEPVVSEEVVLTKKEDE